MKGGSQGVGIDEAHQYTVPRLVDRPGNGEIVLVQDLEKICGYFPPPNLANRESEAHLHERVFLFGREA